MTSMRTLLSVLLIALLLGVSQPAFPQIIVSPSTTRILVEDGTAAAP